MSLVIISTFLREVGSRDIWRGGRAWRFEEREVQVAEGKLQSAGSRQEHVSFVLSEKGG